MANHWSLKYSLKNKFSFLMTLIELANYGGIFYYSLFTSSLLISNDMVILLYIFFRFIIFAFTARTHFSLTQNFMLFLWLWEKFPKFKIHVKHEAAFLEEESLLSHVCKQTDKKFTNLKCETKFRQNINYIDDELFCRQKKYYSNRRIRNG